MTGSPCLLLARDGKVIADDGNKVTFKKSDIHEDPVTGKPVGNIHSYTYRDGDEEYELSYSRENTMPENKFIDTVTGFKKLAAKLIIYDGSLPAPYRPRHGDPPGSR